MADAADVTEVRSSVCEKFKLRDSKCILCYVACEFSG